MLKEQHVSGTPSRRERLKAAVSLANHRREHHSGMEWITRPEGSEERSRMEEAVSIPLPTLKLLLSAAKRELDRT
jgi:hypothetical protein